MSTPTSSTLNGGATAQNVQELIQTTDDRSVSDRGQKISPPPSSDSINSNFGVATDEIKNTTAVHVDHKNLVSGIDYRRPAKDGVTGVMDGIKNPPGPRDMHSQAPLSGRQAPTAGPSPSFRDEVGD